MSRWSLDPPDDDPDGVAYDDTACEDCGRASVAWLCEDCSDQREYWAATMAVRIATADTYQPVSTRLTGVVEVALVPLSQSCDNPVVEVALVPIAPRDAFDLKRMAKAILSADLTQIREVA